MSEQTFKPGDIVVHKLTGEKMLILPADSMETYNRRETYKVRTESLGVSWVYAEEIKKGERETRLSCSRPNCSNCLGQGRLYSPTGYSDCRICGGTGKLRLAQSPLDKPPA